MKGDILGAIASQQLLEETAAAVGNTIDTGGQGYGSNAGKLNASLTQGAEIQQKVDSCNENLKAVIKMLSFGQWEQSLPGVYTVNLPETATYIIVSACGGGGAGGSTDRPFNGNNNGPAGAGGGADAIKNKRYSINPGQTLQVTVGTGGKALVGERGNGGNGTPTVIGNLVTLAGGTGGQPTGENGLAGGNGGGNGGKGKPTPEDGKNGLSPGGRATERHAGGGGSLGNGGSATMGTVGYGGGGYGADKTYSDGQDGGNGYVKITWGDE